MSLTPFPYTFPFTFASAGDLYVIYGSISLPGKTTNFLKDDRIQLHDSLKLRTQELLRKLRFPEVSYEVEAGDLSAVQLSDVGAISVGDRVRVIDEDLAVFVETFVTEIERPLDNPAAAKVHLETRQRTIATALAEATKESIPEARMELAPEQIGLGWPPTDDVDSDPITTLVKWQHPDDETEIDGHAIFEPSVPPEAVYVSEEPAYSGTLDGWVYPSTNDMDASRVRLSDKDDPASSSGRVLDDWKYDDSGGVIDGEEIHIRTRQWFYWAKVTSGYSSGGIQRYTIEDIGPDKVGKGTFYSGVRVIDDTQTMLNSGSFVMLHYPTEVEIASGYPLIAVATKTAQYFFPAVWTKGSDIGP